MPDETYDVSARGYLLRARRLLAQGHPDSLFYAAFELRSGLEARAHEHISEWDHVPAKSKAAWQIKRLDEAAQRAFSGNRLVIDVTFRRGDEFLRLLYTPVRRKGRVAVERLGTYLHAQKKVRPKDDAWWGKFSEQLVAAEQELTFAVSGTLLGPALLRNRREGHLCSEILEGQPMPFVPKSGDAVSAEVRHHHAEGFELPGNAYIWRG